MAVTYLPTKSGQGGFVLLLSGDTKPSGQTYLRLLETDTGKDYFWNGAAWVLYTAGGSGNVSGPGSSTDRAIATWNGTGGTTLRDNSGVTIDAGANITTSGGLTATGAVHGSNIGNITPINLNGNATTFLDGTGNFTVPAGGGGGVLTLITQTITSGSQGNVTFSGISGSYRHLIVRITGRSTRAANVNDPLRIQLNGDTGGNYTTAFWAAASSTSTGGTNTINAASFYVQDFNAATAPASYPSSVEMVFLDYVGTAFFKTYLSHGMQTVADSNTNVYIFSGQGTWASTAAITSIKVFFSNGNFVDGSLVSLYGST